MAAKALSPQAVRFPTAASLGEGDGCLGLFPARVGQSCLGQHWVPLLSRKAGARADSPLARRASWCPQVSPGTLQPSAVRCGRGGDGSERWDGDVLAGPAGSRSRQTKQAVL